MTISKPSSDFIPGTVHLVDLEGTMHSRHAGGGKHDIVLVPAPSSDPDDPLNWSPRRKLQFLSCVCVYTIVVGIASAAIYSILVPISEATNLTVADLNAGTGYMFLAFGWGCLIWQPLAQRYGKRPVYLFSLLATMAIMLWAPFTRSNGQWIANKLLQGALGAPIESLCEISISDVYFTHERGTYMGVYALMLVGSNFVAPVISGFINDAQGWQWVLYWCAIFNGVGFLILFFFMEESNYHRKVVLSIEPDEAASATPASEGSSSAQDILDSEKGTKTPSIAGPQTDFERGETYSKKSFLQKMKLWRDEDLKRNTKLSGMVLRPLIYLSFPVIFFSGFMYGAILCYFNVLNGTTSVILSAPPYNFSSSMAGLSYISCLIGVVVGSYISGPLGDKFVLWKARHNNGIMEPEHRLWLYTVLLVLAPGGLLLWGLGAAHNVHWFGLIFAMGLLGVAITMGCQLPISYCIDSYRDLGADAMVTVILVRNTMSFAVSYGITPWVTNMGYQNAFIVAAFAALAVISLVFGFIKCGRHFRKASVPRYHKYVQQTKDDGTGH